MTDPLVVTAARVLVRRDQPGLNGDIGIRTELDEPTAELGIALAPEHRGQGCATEALEANELVYLRRA